MSTQHGLSLDASDFQRAAAELRKNGYEKAAEPTVRWALKRAANVVRRMVRAELKPHNRTGKMRDRVRTKWWGQGMGFVAGVRTTGVGSNLVVGGVRPHAIATGKVMPLWMGKGAWKRGAGAGITGFATAVQHPGFQGDPFFARGVKRAEPEIQQIIDKSATTMANNLAWRLGGK